MLFSKTRKKTKKSSPNRRLRLESLEYRQLMAGDVMNVAADPAAAQPEAADQRVVGRVVVSRQLEDLVANIANERANQAAADDQQATESRPLTADEYKSLLLESDRRSLRLINRYSQAKANLEKAEAKLQAVQAEVADDPLTKELQTEIDKKAEELAGIDQQIAELDRQIQQLERDAQQPSPTYQVIKIGRTPGHYVVIHNGEQRTVDLRQELKQLPENRAIVAGELKTLETQQATRQEELKAKVEKCKEDLEAARKELNNTADQVRSHLERINRRNQRANRRPRGPANPNPGQDQGTRIFRFRPAWVSADGDVFGQLIGHISTIRSGNTRDLMERWVLRETRKGQWTQLTKLVGELLGKPVELAVNGIGAQDIAEFLFNFTQFVKNRGEQLGEAFNGHLVNKRSREVSGFGLGRVGTLTVCTELKDGEFRTTIQFQVDPDKRGKIVRMGRDLVTLKDWSKTYTGKVVAPRARR